jgi:hypothetical protein
MNIANDVLDKQTESRIVSMLPDRWTAQAGIHDQAVTRQGIRNARLGYRCFRPHRLGVVPDLLTAGHQVTGLTRSDAAAGKVAAVGAEVRRGDLGKMTTHRGTSASFPRAWPHGRRGGDRRRRRHDGGPSSRMRAS